MRCDRMRAWLQRNVDMTWWIWVLIGYVAVLVVMFVGHIIFLQMVPPGLAFMRSAVWPIFILTGWPHGSPPLDLFGLPVAP